MPKEDIFDRLARPQNYLVIDYVDFIGTKDYLDYMELISILTPDYEYVHGRKIAKTVIKSFKNKDVCKLKEKLKLEKINGIEFKFKVNGETPIPILSNFHYDTLSPDNELWLSVYDPQYKRNGNYSDFRRRERIAILRKAGKQYKVPSEIRSSFEIPIKTKIDDNYPLLQQLVDLFSKAIPKMMHHPFYMYIDIAYSRVTMSMLIELCRYENGEEIVGKCVVKYTPIAVGPKETIMEVYKTVIDLGELDDTPMALGYDFTAQTIEPSDKLIKEKLIPWKEYASREGLEYYICHKDEKSGRMFTELLYTQVWVNELMDKKAYYPDEITWQNLIIEELWEKLDCNESKKLYFNKNLVSIYTYNFDQYSEQVYSVYKNLAYTNEKEKVIRAHLAVLRNIFTMTIDELESFLYNYFEIE